MRRYGVIFTNRVFLICQLWKDFLASIDLEVNPLFEQSVNMKVFRMVLKERFTSNSEPKRSPMVVLTSDELNAMRYACGFVPHSLLKKYEAGRIKRSEQCIECLGNMAVAGDSDDFHAYSRHWIDLVNRGGLFPLNDQAFSFFAEVERKVRSILPYIVLSQESCKEETIPLIGMATSVTHVIGATF